MELYNMFPRQLDKFIYNHLQPNTDFLDQMSIAINKICRFLHGYKFQNSVKVIKTIKGGSSGKGTALKNGSDADLVVFFSDFQSFEDQKNKRGGMLNEIYDALLLYQKEYSFAYELSMSKPQIIRESSMFGLFSVPRSLSFQIKSTEDSDSIEFDVLPAYDALGQATYSRPDPEIYIRLIELKAARGEFSTSFTELQRDFVRKSPTKLKSLIRLVKYWYKEYVRRLHKQNLRSGEFLPHKYALELLIIYAWESTKQGQNFNTAEGFRTLLELVVRYQELWLFWTEYYDFSHPDLKKYLTETLQGHKPIILDPADPTGNMAEKVRWDLVAREARRCLQQTCVQGVVGWNVEPVKRISVTIIPPQNVYIVTDRLSINPFSRIMSIKVAILETTEYQMNNYYLELEGTVLEDRKTLASYGVFTKVTLFLKESSSCSLM
uniref:54 kDa 2'-5'-oligoadenylate synthase-like protein 2 n=1 Tax=Callorhinchus milii TaxID=7868 RepID=V9KSH5_CALMI